MSNGITITSDSQLDYCPRCGKETETEKFPVRYIGDNTTKYNYETKCPDHGVITVSPT